MINDIDYPEKQPQNSSGIVLPNNYHQIIERLKIPHLTRDCTDVFFGGPIKYQNKQHWLRPIMYNGFNIHVLYLNCSPDDTKHPHVTFLRTNDMTMKLSKSVFDEKNPRVFIRQSMAGNIVYPHVINPLQSQYMTVDDFLKIHDLLGLGAEKIDVDLSDPELHSNSIIRTDEVVFLHERGQHFNGAEPIMVADFVIPNDPWVHYQIITSSGIEKLKGSKERVIVRLDSGCDSGQIYTDDACECKEQLHAAVSTVIQDGGLVLHMPTQDGRGYGSGPKMETEGLKEGLPMKTNIGDVHPMDTVVAGKHLFGENYDIRTFDGAGKVLKKLGINAITLLTNNVRKLSGLRAANIDVETKDSQVIKPSCARHVIAKLGSGLYL